MHDEIATHIFLSFTTGNLKNLTQHMDGIVTAHAKDLDGLSHNLGKIADLCESLMDKFLSKEMEYLTTVLRTLEQENQRLKESVEEWKSRYEAKAKEIDEMKLGYIKPRREVDRSDGDQRDMPDSDSNAPKATSQDPLRTEKTVSKDKGKAPMITPPNSNRKITTFTNNNEKKSTSQDPKPIKCQSKRKVIPSSDDDDIIPPKPVQKYRSGPNPVRPIASSSKETQDIYKRDTFSKNFDTESEWDELALRQEKVFGSSGKEKEKEKEKNSPISHQKEERDIVIDLTL